MALIAHYPLNGDTKDYSGYGRHGINYGALVNEEGKIGKCYKLDGLGYISLPVSLSARDVGAISMWYNAESAYNYNTLWDTSLNADHWECWIYANGNIAARVLGVLSNVPFSIGSWRHLTFTWDRGGSQKLYLDGELKSEIAMAGWVTSGNEVNIGGNLNSKGKGLVNDIRIYDHALSDKEVKELAKAKVLHYKFDEHEEPTENLAGGVTSFYSPYHTFEKSGNNFKMEMKSANYLTLGNGKDYQGQTVSVSGYLFKNGLPHALPTKRLSTFHSKNASKWLFNSVTGYFEITQEWTSTNTWVFHTSTGAVTGDVLEIKNMQFEIKATPTGYTEGVRGGGSIVKDSSGFGNDGTVAVTTAPTWSEDSPVGRGSMDFSGSKFIDANHKIPLWDDFTVSFWVNTNPTSTATLGCSRTSLGKGFSIFLLNEGTIRWDTGDQQWSTGHAVKLNQWVHYTLVRRGNAKELYENAVLVKSTTYTGSMTNLGNSYSIGMSQVGGSEYGNPLNGAVSDYRIYATALTPEDIIELYQTRASVDNEGNLFVQEIDEITDTSKEVDSKGIARFKEFNEVGGENKMSIKNDGVVYVNEIMEA